MLHYVRIYYTGPKTNLKGQAPTLIFSKEKGVTNIDLLANHQKHLHYCPVNSSTRVAGQFRYQSYLSVYTVCKGSS